MLRDIIPERVSAYFQPIISIDTKTVYSYEALGRYTEADGGVISLGRFFSDPSVSDEEALAVDRLVRRDAMRKYAEERRAEVLFINIRLAWLTKFLDGAEELPTLCWAREFGIAPEKLVIEITEEEFNTSAAYQKVITRYKDAGCRVALDDFGQNASNLDRLALIKPDIIKVSMEYIHKSEKNPIYREYLRAIVSFAEKLGIEILYEGVETQRQLDICMDIKGRYYQGFLLARPQPTMRGAAVDFTVFADSAAGMYEALQNRITNISNHRRALDAKTERAAAERPPADINEFLAGICRELPDIKRVYICDRQGNQLSRNIERNADGIIQSEYSRKNWLWRKHFCEALEYLALGGASYISNVYRDFSTKEQTSTYFRVIGGDMLLCVDI
jgi:EAL domain-containing protein (putative c-di-GMP-specific phosphodiesterase class I)